MLPYIKTFWGWLPTPTFYQSFFLLIVKQNSPYELHYLLAPEALSALPHGLQPTRLLCPWDFPGKSTGVGCHCLLRKKAYGA